MIVEAKIGQTIVLEDDPKNYQRSKSNGINQARAC